MSQNESWEDWVDSQRIVLHNYTAPHKSMMQLAYHHHHYKEIQMASMIIVVDQGNTRSPPYRYNFIKERYGSVHHMLEGSPIMRRFLEMCPNVEFHCKEDGPLSHMLILSDQDLIIARMLL